MKLKILVGTALLCLAANAQQNVLFINIDDLRNELNCYGADHMVTPNIDTLAASGVKFTRAYVQQAVCAASRASYLTGLRPETTGVNYPYTDWFINTGLQLYPDFTTRFHDAGYYSRTLGKIHHGVKINLTENHFSIPTYYYVNPDNTVHYDGGRGPLTPPYEAGMDASSNSVPDRAYRDGQYADEALLTMERAVASGDPFFIAVGFQKPHLPFCAPKAYWDLYDRASLPLPPEPDAVTNGTNYSYSNWAFDNYSGPYPKDANGDPRKLTDDEVRLLKHGYAACVSYVDAQIGKMLAKLDTLGIRDNTIIVLASDHGWHLGDLMVWGKSMNFDLTVRAPLIVVDPARTATAGSACDALVEYVDIYPTLLELAGIPLPTYLEGTSVVPLLDDVSEPWKSAIFHQFNRGTATEGFAVLAGDIHYIEWVDRDTQAILAQELYDHSIDPNESFNRASEPAYASVVGSVQATLQAGWQAALPPRHSMSKDLHALNISRTRAADSITIEMHQPGTLTARLFAPSGELAHVYHDAPASIGQQVSIPLELPAHVAPGAYKLEIQQGSTLRIITLEK